MDVSDAIAEIKKGKDMSDEAIEIVNKIIAPGSRLVRDEDGSVTYEVMGGEPEGREGEQ